MKLESYKYTANFCEENIWHLCQHPQLSEFKKTVFIISNHNRNCPLWCQKSSIEDGPVRWDYHVILLVSNGIEKFIYDFDSTLDLPSTLSEYINHTFKPTEQIIDIDKPLFKTIPSEDYIQQFNSNRNHMKDEHGEMKSSQPSWPLINNKEGLPLPDLLDFSKTSKQKIHTLEEMLLIVKAK